MGKSRVSSDLRDEDAICQHPIFDNELIISKILSLLSHRDWKNTRQVNTLWLRETDSFFIKNSIIQVRPEGRYTAAFRKYKYKHSNFSISSSTGNLIDSDIQILLKHINRKRMDIGVKFLEVQISQGHMDKFYLYNLVKWTPQLEVLKLVFETVLYGNNMKFEDESLTFEHLQRLDLQCAYYVEYDWFILEIISWVLKRAANLKCVILKSELSAQMDREIVEVIVSQEFKLLNEIHLAFADPKVMTLLLGLSRPLKILKIEAISASDLNIYRDILVRNSKSFEEVEIGVCPSEEADISSFEMPPLPNLKKLKYNASADYFRREKYGRHNSQTRFRDRLLRVRLLGRNHDLKFLDFLNLAKIFEGDNSKFERIFPQLTHMELHIDPYYNSGKVFQDIFFHKVNEDLEIPQVKFLRLDSFAYENTCKNENFLMKLKRIFPNVAQELDRVIWAWQITSNNK